MNKKMINKFKKIATISTISLAGVSALTLGVISRNTSLNVDLNNENLQAINSSAERQAVSTDYQAVFSSIKTTGDASKGGVFGSDSATQGTKGHSIYLTTYNNILAWERDVTKHRAFIAAKDDKNFVFDADNAKITSFKKVRRMWNGVEKDILYVSLSTFESRNIPNGAEVETAKTAKTIILPYDAVSGEDLITVSNADGSIDWHKNLFVSEKNDILIFNRATERFYLYRFDNINSFQTNKCTAFVHFYGKGFEEVTISQNNWSNEMVFNSSLDSTKNTLYAIIPTSSNYNTAIYYDNTIGKGNYNNTFSDNEGRMTAVVLDKDLNVVKKVSDSNAMMFTPVGVDCYNNTPVYPADTPEDKRTPIPLMLEYGMDFGSDDTYSYSGYIQSGTYNCLTIYQVNKTNGDISVKSQLSLQEGAGPSPTEIGFDVTYSCYNEENRTIYFSNTWSTGGQQYNGKAINAIKVTSDYTCEFEQVTQGTEGLYQDYRNALNYAVAPYYGDDSIKGVICSRSGATVDGKSSLQLSNTDLVSYTKTNGNYNHKTNSERQYFEDFQTRATQIWNSTDDKKWASNITKEMITNNAGPNNNGNIVKIVSKTPKNTSFSADSLKPNDEKGTLEFNLEIVATETNNSPPTNSSIFINLDGFRTLGNYDFVYVAEANNSTNSVVASKKKYLEDVYFNKLPSEITPSIINSGFTGTDGKVSSPFWQSPEKSFYNDFYSSSHDEEWRNQRVTIDKTTLSDETGHLEFSIDFTDVTPDSIKKPLGGKNIKTFRFDSFAKLSDNTIIVNKGPQNFGSSLYSEITIQDVVQKYIVPYGVVNGSGKTVQTGNLIPVENVDQPDSNKEVSWLKDNIATKESEKYWRWKMVKEKTVNNTGNQQIYAENPVPAFTLWYQFGTNVKESQDDMVKVLEYTADGHFKYNSNTQNDNGNDASSAAWKDLPMPHITSIYEKYFKPKEGTPLISQALTEHEIKVANEVIGNTTNVSAFDNYGLNADISPYELWQNLKNNKQDIADLFIDFHTYFDFGSLPFDSTKIEIGYAEGNNPNPVMEKGGIVIRCNNADNLGGGPNDIVKPIQSNDKDLELNGYFDGSKQKDSWLDLSFEIVNNTDTSLTNTELGIGSDGALFKITDQFRNRSSLKWTGVKILKTDVKNIDPYFNYTVSELSSSVKGIKEITASGIVDITVQEIMDSGNQALTEGLSLDKTLDELNPAILSEFFEENPLIIARNISDVTIYVVKDNINGIATLLISVPLTESPSKSASVEVEQTINISGFKKPTNWFLVAGIPSIIAALILIAIISIVIVKKVSNKNLKKFIDNQE